MNNQKHNRRSIRLKGYDYSQAGAYFVTICTQNRDCLFGEIIEGEMVLNDAGKMVQTIWDQIPPHYPGIGIDAFIAMPNHIHGIVIVGAATGGRPGSGNYDSVHGQHGHGQHGHGQPQGVAPTLSLADVVHRYKTMTTKRYTDGVKKHGWPPFPKRIWQRNYYEHIIRNENDYDRIYEYIQNNPVKWELDSLHPANVGAAPRGRPLMENKQCKN